MNENEKTMRRSRRLWTAIVFLGAFLLFSIQPLVAKHILPYFGSSFSVWSTTVAFFTTSLFVGYLLVHALTNLNRKKQLTLHRTSVIIGNIALLFGALYWSAPLLPPHFFSLDAFPFFSVFFHLAIAVLIPYLLLSLTSVLAQRWINEENPYYLYAVSNAGSFLGLLAYPFLVEPFLPLPLQGWLWTILFATYSLLIIFTSPQRKNAPEQKEEERQEPQRHPFVVWISLSALASFILVAGTTLLTIGVSGLPLLWVLPLAAYLLTFVFAFSGMELPASFGLLPIGIAGIASSALSFPYFLKVAFIVFSIFAAGLYLHQTLYALRPHERSLSRFYIAISGGGAAGSLLASFGAPLLLKTLSEYTIGLALFIGTSAFILFTKRREFVHTPRMGFIIAAFVLVAFGAVFHAFIKSDRGIVAADSMEIIFRDRTFYGIYAVLDATQKSTTTRYLVNGSIIHGFEYQEPDRRAEPTTYYVPDSAPGLFLRNTSEMPRKIGIIGLGSGTLAAYCHDGDLYRFYEIDPLDIEIAEEYFTFLDFCREKGGTIEHIPGDARKSLENEGPNRYDALIVDAFTDDSIPMHLLTREAFALYKRHLAPGGVLFVHVSNKYVDLPPIVAAAATAVDFESRLITYSGMPGETYPSLWVISSEENPSRHLPTRLPPATYSESTGPEIPAWTDAYSSLLPHLKIREEISYYMDFFKKEKTTASTTPEQ